MGGLIRQFEDMTRMDSRLRGNDGRNLGEFLNNFFIDVIPVVVICSGKSGRKGDSGY